MYILVLNNICQLYDKGSCTIMYLRVTLHKELFVDTCTVCRVLLSLWSGQNSRAFQDGI